MWSTFPARITAGYLVGQWATAGVVLLGIAAVLRGRAALSAGLFLAIGLLSWLGIAAQAIQGLAYARWQTDLYLGLGALEGVALLTAALMAIRRET